MSADKQIKEILAKYDEDFASNTWPVPGGKARAIYHKTIERIAARAGVKFDPPQVLNAEQDNVAMIVTGSLGDRVEWSVGEASPKNNKNAYPYSMAEKRGKDRVVLKLVGLHGLLYSEEEADDFRNSAPAQPARAEQAGGELSSPASPSADVAYVSLAKTAIQNATSVEELDQWWKDESATRKANGVEGGIDRATGEVVGTPAYLDLAKAFSARKSALTKRAA